MTELHKKFRKSTVKGSSFSSPNCLLCHWLGVPTSLDFANLQENGAKNDWAAKTILENPLWLWKYYVQDMGNKITEMHILKKFSVPISRDFENLQGKGLKMTELPTKSWKSSFPFDFDNINRNFNKIMYKVVQ